MDHKYKVGDRVRIGYHEDILSEIKDMLDEINWIVIVSELHYGLSGLLYSVEEFDNVFQEKCIKCLVTEEYLTRPTVNRFQLMDFSDEL